MRHEVTADAYQQGAWSLPSRIARRGDRDHCSPDQSPLSACESKTDSGGALTRIACQRSLERGLSRPLDPPNALDQSPNADPTRVPSPASSCTERCDSDYAVRVYAPLCPPLGRSGNAVSGVTRHEGSNPSRSGIPLWDGAIGLDLVDAQYRHPLPRPNRVPRVRTGLMAPAPTLWLRA